MAANDLYVPLNPAASEVRILKLLPGKFDHALHCTMEVFSLNDDPKFEALSYVWGDYSMTKPVYVNGHLLHVTSNLETALRYLRRRWRPRVLWADAICINQNDTKEKNHQVPSMSRIYTQCSQTVAWLGLPTPEIMPLISVMSSRFTDRYLRTKALQKYLDAMAITSLEVKIKRSIFYLKLAVGGLHMLEFSYWHRIWTYQELWLPKKTICICGNLAFDAIPRSNRPEAQMLESYLIRPAAILRNTREFLNHAPTSLSAEILQLEDDYNNLLLRIEKSGYMSLGVQGQVNRAPGSLSVHLVASSGRKCSNRRDRIYGIYGLCPSQQENYPVDYEKPHWVVMQEATIRCLFEISLGIYMCYERLSEQGLDMPVPSWVLDFSCPLNPTGMSTSHMKNKDWAPPRDSEIAVLDSTTLRLPAYKLGTCVDTLLFSREPAELMRQLSRLFRESDEPPPMQPPRITYTTPQRILDIISKVALLPRLGLPEWRHILEHSLLDKPLGLPEMEARLIMEGLQRLLGCSLTLFATEAELNATPGDSKYMFAAATGSVLEGDLLVLPACNGPAMALRREQSQSGSSGSAAFFTMVSPVCLEGISGLDEGELSENGRNLINGLRKTGCTDFLIH